MTATSLPKRAATALAFFVCAGASSLVMAAFPEKPVTLISPFAAGAAADAVIRPVAKKLGDLWGQQVIVDNRPGVHGMIGGATAKPDGYTLLLAAGSGIVTAPLTNPRLSYKPGDFAPVGRVSTSQSVLVVNGALGVNNWAELLALAKSKPGSLSYSSSGQGAPNHLGMELLQQITGTSMVHVPYRGAAPAMVDLLGNQVQLGINAVPTVLPYLRQGKLKVIAVAGEKRSHMLPDTPTFKELGVKGMETEVWYGIFAPAGTPQPLLNKLSADLEKVLKDPQIVDQLAKSGAEAAPLAPADLKRYIAEESQRWTRLIRERNLKVEE